jgi:hypothetical protein
MEQMKTEINIMDKIYNVIIRKYTSLTLPVSQRKIGLGMHPVLPDTARPTKYIFKYQIDKIEKIEK